MPRLPRLARRLAGALVRAGASNRTMATAMGTEQIQNTVYFSHGMKELAFLGGDVVKVAADNIKAKGAKSVTLVGHCSTAEEKPDELSKARAQSASMLCR